MKHTVHFVVLACAAVVALAACSTARVKVAREEAVPTARFERVTVLPFENAVGPELPGTAAENVAGAVIATLRKHHPAAFRTVTSDALSASGDLVVRGKITEYNPGSKALRFLLIGLSPGKLQLQVTLSDGGTGRTIEEFSTSGEVVAGGVMGASMGIEDMIDSAAKKIAERIARHGASE